MHGYHSNRKVKSKALLTGLSDTSVCAVRRKPLSRQTQASVTLNTSLCQQEYKHQKNNPLTFHIA